MKARYFLVEEQRDGKLLATACAEGTSLYWARNKARAESGLTRNVVHICSVRESVNVKQDESS